jgi:hypothetical protein
MDCFSQLARLETEFASGVAIEDLKISSDSTR